MFNKLIASEGAKCRVWGPRTVAISVAVHGLLLAGAVYASVAIPAPEKAVEEEVTFIEIEEAEPEAPEPQKAPPPPPPEAPPEAPPAPRGFQELIPPDVPPGDPGGGPEPGRRERGGLQRPGRRGRYCRRGGGWDAAERRGPPADSVFEAASLDYDSRPEIANRARIGSLLSRYYPRILEDAGISGQTVVQLVINSDGKVAPASIRVISSTHEQFGDATVKAIEGFRFKPGRYQGKAVPVVIQIPITWTVQR